MSFLMATNGVASRPPKRRPTGTPHALVNSVSDPVSKLSLRHSSLGLSLKIETSSLGCHLETDSQIILVSKSVLNIETWPPCFSFSGISLRVVIQSGAYNNKIFVKIVFDLTSPQGVIFFLRVCVPYEIFLVRKFMFL